MKNEEFELGPLQKKWIEELRSGKYKQGDNYLNNNDSYCCLGIACEFVLNLDSCDFTPDPSKKQFEYDGATAISSIPHPVFQKLGLRDGLGRSDNKYLDEQFITEYVDEEGNSSAILDMENISLSYLNDSGITFDKIADILEEYPQAYFKESK